MAKYVTPIGRVAWSNMIDQTKNLKDDLEWNVGLVVAEENAIPILELVQKALDDRRKSDPSFPTSDTGLNFPYGPSMRKDETGTKVPEVGFLTFKFKRPAELFRKAVGRKEPNTAPLIFDSKGRPVKIPAIAPGSEGKVIFDTYAYDKAGQKGVGLQLIGFQVVKLEVDTIELDEVEGGWVAEEEAKPVSPMEALMGEGDGRHDDLDGDEIPY
jgi:hypothetical protein